MGKKERKKRTTKDTVPLCIQEVSQRGPVHGIFFSSSCPVHVLHKKVSGLQPRDDSHLISCDCLDKLLVGPVSRRSSNHRR